MTYPRHREADVVLRDGSTVHVRPVKAEDVAAVRAFFERITLLTDRDAAEMVRSLATFPLLDGYRGAPRADVAALEDLLLRVSALVEAHPQVAELDCNPVKVLPNGAVVVDARVRVEAATPPLPLAARRR